MSDSVGDTELISTFIQRTNITDITWIYFRDNKKNNEDVSAYIAKCDEELTTKGYQCLPPKSHLPWYIWTRYPEAKDELSL